MQVAAAVIERDGRILLARRRPDGPHPLKWEFPGGKVEPGETPEQALRRELREELDIVATIGPELARYEYAYPGQSAIELIFYSVIAVDGEPRNRSFASICWEAPGAIADYDFLEGDREFIRRTWGRTD